MKKTYNTPNLTVHGSIESITECVGDSNASDTGEFNSQPFECSAIDLSGSQDGVLIPD